MDSVFWLLHWKPNTENEFPVYDWMLEGSTYQIQAKIQKMRTKNIIKSIIIEIRKNRSLVRKMMLYQIYYFPITALEILRVAIQI